MEKQKKKTSRRNEKVAQKEQHLTEEKFQTAFDYAPVGMCLLLLDGRFNQVNEAFCRMLGYSKQELLSMTFMDVTHPDDLAISKTWTNKLITNNPADAPNTDLEKRCIHKAGHIVWGMVRSAVLRDADGSPRFFLAHVQDITERKYAEAVIDESRQHASVIANLIDNSSQPFAVEYPDGRLGICNQAFCDLLGYPKQQFLSLNWETDLTPPEWHEKERGFLAELERTGKPVRFEKEYFQKDKTRVQVEMLIHLAKDDKGAPRYYFAFITDISDRKRAETRLSKLNETLLSFGMDAIENINRLVQLCGEQLGATYALYNRLHNGMLAPLARWNTPPDFSAEPKPPDGRLCYEVIRDLNAEVKIFRNLQDSSHAATNPSVGRYGLHTYVGKAVIFENKHVGSLCVVYKSDPPFTEKDKEFLQIVASAIAAEEMRKAAKDSLVESQSRLALSLRAASLGVWDRDVEKNILTWDDRMFEMYGFAKDGFPGTFEAWKACIHPEDRERVVAIHNAALRGETEYKTDFRIIRPDGRVRYIKVDGIVLRDAKAQPIRVVGLNQDVTDQKLAEIATAHAEKTFRGLLESIHLLALILDPDGNIVFCNDYFLTITGWSRSEVLGKNWIEMFSPSATRETLKAFFKESVSNGSIPTHYENSISTREGAIRLVVWDNAILRNPDGAITGLASIGTDVTEHRKLEEQLRQSQKLEAIGQLSGGVAHDFNNILSAIVGYAHLALMKMPADDPCRSNIEFILEASDRATTLTQSLLSFSRKQVINPQPHNLNDIIKRLQKLLVRLIREDITITTSYIEEDLPVLADSVQIEQMIMNLVTNARDAMPMGGHLAIRTDYFSMDENFIATHGYGRIGCYAYLAIADTGEGLDPKTKERIFEPFFTTKAPGKGTGLGLAMVYGAVKQHGGYIDVESEPGKGATFKIFLPLISGYERISSSKGTAEKYCGGTETILIAEDNAALRQLSCQILRDQGYSVIEAFDGVDALEKYADNKDCIALTIFDVIMPRKNGKEAYEEIRAINPSAKAIFVSGYAEDIISKEGLLESDIHFLLKPMIPADLLKKVREVLDA